MEENRLFKNWKRALILSLQLPNKSNSEVISAINEMSSLAYTLGGKVIGEIIQTRSQIDNTYFFGKGKIKEIKNSASENVLIGEKSDIYAERVVFCNGYSINQ